MSKILVRPALWFCACNLLAAALGAQCSNPTPVPNGTYTTGDHSQVDNNALSAANVVLSGGASATFVARNCIQLLPGFHASAIGATVPTTFHAWVDLAPTAVSVSPTSGNGLSGPFTWTVSSPSGHSNLSHVFALFNTTSGSTANACYIHYDPGSNLLYLADNASATWLGGFVPGSSDSASNSQCSISGSGASFSTPGTQVALTVPVTFQASFSGTKNEYLLALDNSGLYTEWQQMGTWTIPQQYYLTTSVSPSGSGTLVFSPPCCTYSAGTQVTITAAPAGGYQFSGFTGVDSSIGSTGYVAMNGNRSVTAYFTAIPPPATPTLRSPASGSSNVPTPVTVTWNASSGATVYDLYFGTSSPPPFYASTTSTSYPLGSISAASKYYWNVVAKNGGGYSPASATWGFATSATSQGGPFNVTQHLYWPMTVGNKWIMRNPTTKQVTVATIQPSQAQFGCSPDIQGTSDVPATGVYEIHCCPN